VPDLWGRTIKRSGPRLRTMKRLVLEFPYQGYWRTIFGSNLDTVEVMEAMKCFKCDREGFALICKIRFLDKNMSTNDLLTGGAIRDIETLYRENDESETVFISGGFPETSRGRLSRPAKVFSAGAPEFIDTNRMKVALVGEEKEIQKLLHNVGKSRTAPKVLSLTRLGAKSETSISLLTTKQRQAVLVAYGLGYYDVPRRISSEKMARLLKIDKSTLAEHLRKAEKRLIKGIIAG
jgi:predicted DNA binding protein